MAKRLARARISAGLKPGVSSIKRGASDNICTAEVTRGQSSSSNLPVRMLCWSMRPKDDIMRMAKESAGISIENTSTGLRLLIAACSAMFMTRVVLPIEGLPATIIKSAGCKPEVMLSKSVKPVSRPVIS